MAGRRSSAKNTTTPDSNELLSSMIKPFMEYRKEFDIVAIVESEFSEQQYIEFLGSKDEKKINGLKQFTIQSIKELDSVVYKRVMQGKDKHTFLGLLRYYFELLKTQPFFKENILSTLQVEQRITNYYIGLFDIKTAIVDVIVKNELALGKQNSKEEIELSKLKWKGSPSQFGYIMYELIENGYIERPHKHFTKMAKIFMTLFEIDTTTKNLENEINIAKNSMIAKNKSKFKIPPIDKLD